MFLHGILRISIPDYMNPIMIIIASLSTRQNVVVQRCQTRDCQAVTMKNAEFRLLGACGNVSDADLNAQRRKQVNLYEYSIKIRSLLYLTTVAQSVRRSQYGRKE